MKPDLKILSAKIILKPDLNDFIRINDGILQLTHEDSPTPIHVVSFQQSQHCFRILHFVGRLVPVPLLFVADQTVVLLQNLQKICSLFTDIGFSGMDLN